MDGTKRGKTRGVLSRRRIVDASIRIVEESGGDALTFRRLGTELGVHPSAIYRHFRDKNELTLALVDRLNEDAMKTFAPDPDWLVSLRDLCLRLRAAHYNSPRVGSFVMARTSRSQYEFQGVENFLSTLRRGGFGDEDAAVLYRVISEWVLAFAYEEAAFMSLPEATREADKAAWREDYHHVSPRKYPTIFELAPHIPAIDDPSVFELGLDLLLESIARKAEAAAGSATDPRRVDTGAASADPGTDGADAG